MERNWPKIKQEIRSWKIHLRSDKEVTDLAKMFNAKVQGWVNYYGRYYKSAMYPSIRNMERYLERWVMRKYKRFKGRKRKARTWLGKVRGRKILKCLSTEGWALAHRLHNRSCMSRDVHVQFWEGLWGKSPWATRPVVHSCSKQEAQEIRKCLEERLNHVGLELHPDKTKIIYCNDSSRKGGYGEEVTFDFSQPHLYAQRSKGRVLHGFSSCD